jgi:hypothetical protein
MPEALAAGGKATRDVAFCLGQLNINEKGLKRLDDGWKLFEAALAEGDVYESLSQAVARGRKAAKVEAVKAQFEAFEARLAAAHEERSETAAADARATSHEGRAPRASTARAGAMRGDGDQDGEDDGGNLEEDGAEGGAPAAASAGVAKAKENAAPATKGRGKAAAKKPPAAAKAASKKPAARKKKVRASGLCTGLHRHPECGEMFFLRTNQQSGAHQQCSRASVYPASSLSYNSLTNPCPGGVL